MIEVEIVSYSSIPSLHFVYVDDDDDNDKDNDTDTVDDDVQPLFSIFCYFLIDLPDQRTAGRTDSQTHSGIKRCWVASKTSLVAVFGHMTKMVC